MRLKLLFYVNLMLLSVVAAVMMLGVVLPYMISVDSTISVLFAPFVAVCSLYILAVLFSVGFTGVKKEITKKVSLEVNQKEEVI